MSVFYIYNSDLQAVPAFQGNEDPAHKIPQAGRFAELTLQKNGRVTNKANIGFSGFRAGVTDQGDTFADGTERDGEL